MSETIENLKKRFPKWRSALESKGLKVNLEKTKLMVCGSEGEIIQSKIDPCGKRVTVNLLIYAKCDQWIRERCLKLKKVTPSSAKFLVSSKCNKAASGAGEVQQNVMCDKLETVKQFCHLGDRLNASGGCEVIVTAKTRLGWKKFKEWGEILFGKKFFLQMKRKENNVTAM